VAAGETPLTQAEKKRIRDLEAELRRVNMENAFLKKASAYFASRK
jgi:transposase-like protein